MVSGDDSQHLGIEILVRPQQVDRVADMRLDEFELPVVERARLAQDRIVDLYLADVLEQACQPHLPYLAAAQANEAREHHCMDRDIECMVVGVVVGALEAGEPQQRIGVALHTGGHLADEAVEAFDIDSARAVDLHSSFTQGAIDVIDDRGRIEQLRLEAAAPILAANTRDMGYARRMDPALEAAGNIEELACLEAGLDIAGMAARQTVQPQQTRAHIDHLAAVMLAYRQGVIDHHLAAVLLQRTHLVDVL